MLMKRKYSQKNLYICKVLFTTMPNISKSAGSIPASAIRMLTPFADQAKAEGVKVYHLNIGAPDIESPASAVKAAKEFSFGHLPYSNSAGSAELRQKMLEKYYNPLGISGLDIDDIIVTTAGSEALSFIFHAAFDPGDELLVLEPYYCNYNTLALMCGIKVVAVHTDIRHNFDLPSAEELEAAISPRTKGIIICNPSNPTGKLLTKKDLLAIADICRRHSMFLISDEAYREFCYTEEPYFSALQIPGLSENVIVVDSASKRYNLCGARIGCIISRNKELMDLMTRFAQARLCPPVLGQQALLGALDADGEYFSAVREEYIARRNFTIEALNKIEGVFSPMPQGAFYTVAELPVQDATAFCKWLLTDYRSPEGETLMITPAESFYAAPGIGRNQVRIAYVLEVPALRRAMAILENALKSYK